MTNKTVVVTGIGAITPLAATAPVTTTVLLVMDDVFFREDVRPLVAEPDGAGADRRTPGRVGPM